jgi:hypothetical protein
MNLGESNSARGALDPHPADPRVGQRHRDPALLTRLLPTATGG